MLKIKQVTFNNWRSLYKMQPIVFSEDEKKNVTLIRGNNESGKTAILKGILWSLYGSKTDHMTRSYSNHLNRINKQALKEGDTEYSVKIHLQNDEKQFTIHRESSLMKGKKPEEGNFQERISVSTKGEVYQGEEAQQLINSFFENQISRFYLFDGEMLDEYQRLVDGTESELANKIKISIEDILRVTSIKNAKRALKVIESNALKDFNSDQTIGEESKKTTSKIEQLNNEIKELEGNKKQIEDDIADLESKKRDCETKLSSKADQSDLIKNRSTISNEIKGYVNKIDEVESNLYSLLENIHLDFLEKIKKELLAKKISDKDRLDEDLRKFQGQSLLQDLIENQDISDESKEVIRVLLNPNDVIDLEKIEEERFNISSEIKLLNSKNFSSNQTSILSNSNELQSQRRKRVLAESKLNSINQALQNLDELSPEEIELLEDLPSKISNYQNKIVRKSLELDASVENSIAFKIQDKLSKKAILDDLPIQKINNLSSITYELSKDLFSIFEKSVSELSHESKLQVEREANSIYKTLRIGRHKSELVLKINDNFGLEIYTQNGEGDLLETSAGGAQIVALSLILALRRCIGIEAPLIMDTPMGRLDLAYRESIIKTLPSLGTQLVLLVQPGEIEQHAAHDSMIRPKVGTTISIDKIDDLRSEIHVIKS